MIKQIEKDLLKIYQSHPNRLKHVKGVKDTALAFGKKYNLDLYKLEVAALLHDYTKYESTMYHKEIIEEHCKDSELILSQFNDALLHSFSARAIAELKYGITDTEILGSIKYHTVGKADMNMYEKILFISDYIEPNRVYPSCVKARKIAETDLDKAVFTAIDDSINFYENINDLVPQLAYEARKYYRELLEAQNG